MPIALNRATRITEFLLTSGKEYIALMHLHKTVQPSKIQREIRKYTGKIKQIPPLKSSVKRVEREREIYYIKTLEIENQDVLFKIGCEAGTYIRKWISDFGHRLNINAHMVQLIRTKIAKFTDQNWHTLHDLKDAYESYKQGKNEELRKIILPIESAIQHMPKIHVFDTTVDTLCHGASLSIPGISKLDSEIKQDDLVAILSLKNELIAIGKSFLTSEEIMEKEKGLAVKISKVFMPPNTYPKFNIKTKQAP